jgi:purine-binding chemotaxis protein CheW
MAVSDSKQYIVIFLENEQYAIEIKYIDSIITMQKITRVPKSQPHYKGVINLRGDIIPVMSIRKKINQSEDVYTDKTRVIIVRPDPQAAPAGLIADEVKEVISLKNEDVNQLKYDKLDENTQYSTGVGKYGKDLITILNIPVLVMDKELAAQVSG